MASLEELLDSLTRFKRLERAKNMPDNVIKTLLIDEKKKYILVEIQGKQPEPYTIEIKFDEKEREISHDCADWLQHLDVFESFCKHVSKVFLSIPENLATEILNSIYNNLPDWKFTEFNGLQKK